jgi:hypothetical protein
MVEPRGIEPRSAELQNTAEPQQNDANTVQSSALDSKAPSGNPQKSASSEQIPGTSTHPKSVPSVADDSDLAEVVAGWDQMSAEDWARILKIVRASH